MTDDAVWCSRCKKTYPDAGDFCPEHRGQELTTVPELDAPAREPDPVREPDDGQRDAPRTVCWNCRTRATSSRNDTCAACHSSLVPPALVIRFPSGAVVLRDRESSAMLGRAGEYGRIFRRYPNVSRQHATVRVDAAGDAWVTPVPEAPNGTFVNDEEILSPTRVRPGDQIRLATDQEPSPGPVSERVRLPRREPVDQPPR